MNICIIGNSHVGSLKRSWDEIKANYQGHDLIFFAHRSDGLDGLIPQDGKLVPTNEKLATALEFTSGGRKDIDPGEYDVFVIYGTGLNISANEDSGFYSGAVVEMSLKDLVTNTLSFELLERLRTLTGKPVFIGHLPLMPAAKSSAETMPDDYGARVERINELVYRPLNAELVKQPLSTIVNGKNTHADFSRGSKALAIGDSGDNALHPEGDNDHMNDQFGEIWLRHFLEGYVEKVISRALEP